MNHFFVTMLGGLCISLTICESAPAGWGALLRKGVTAAAKGSNKVSRKAVSTKATRLATTKVGHVAGQTSRKMSRVGVKSSRAIVPGSRIVVNNLGVEGGQLLGRLSTQSGQQLAEISGELAKSPYRREWLATLSSHGDEAVQWLWKRKGSIFCATAATAIALKPEEFLQAVESATNVATAEVAEHVVAPLAKEMAVEAAATFPWDRLWLGLGISGAALGCWVAWKRRPSR